MELLKIGNAFHASEREKRKALELGLIGYKGLFQDQEKWQRPMQQEQDESDRGIWLSFRLAAKEVERRRGCSWSDAQKAVLGACKSGKLKWRSRSRGGPDVMDIYFWHWLDKPKPKPQPKKRSRIKAYLAAIFHNHCVPGDYSRKALRADLLERDNNLYPLDGSTLKSAVDEYNAERP